MGPICPEHVDFLIPWFVQVESKEELGEWVGLCKIDKEGKPRKIVKCSTVVVKVSRLVDVAEGGVQGC